MELIKKCINYLKDNLLLTIAIAAVVAVILIVLIVVIVRSSKKKRRNATATQTNKKIVSIEVYRAIELRENAQARAKKAEEDKVKREAIWKEVEAKLAAQRLAYEQANGISQTTQETQQAPAQEPVCEQTNAYACEQPVSLPTEEENTAETERLAMEQAEEERKAEEARIAKEQAIAAAKAKAEAATQAKAEEERIAKEQAEEQARVQAEKERITRAKAAAEKLAIEQEQARAQAKLEREAKENAEKEKLAKKQAEESEKVKAQQQAIAKAKAEQEEKAKAERAAKQKVRAQAAENAKAEQEAKTQAYAQVKAEQEVAIAKAQSTELYEELKDAEMEDEIWYDANETDLAARYKGKWLVCRMITEDASEDEMFFFELHASNGEKLLSSEEYTSYAGAMRGIQTHKTNIEKGNFKIALTKKDDYIFKLLSGKNLLLCMGENYPTRARCERAIASTKRFAATAVIDENVQDHVVKVPVEDTAELPAIEPNGKGKWIISAAKGANGEDLFFFELFANNGEKLLSSEEYTTYIGAVNGITTHKANIEKDNFKISLTKRGDYIYKLLNGNGQLLCLGEHYKTKRLCQNAVESVKRFALNSPVLTDAKILN